MTRQRLQTVLGGVAAAAGLLVVGTLLVTTDALGAIRRLPPALLLMIPATFLPIGLGVVSWSRAFPRAPGSTLPPWPTLFAIRLAGEAINNGLVSAYVAGEPVKGLLAARHGVTPAAGLASALIGKTTLVLGEVLFLLVAAVPAALLFGGAGPLVRALMISGGVGLVVVALFVVVQRQSMVGRGARVLRALRLGPRRLWNRALPGADAIDQEVSRYYRTQRWDLSVSVLAAFAGWLVGAAELWLYLSLASDVAAPLALAVALEGGVLVAKGLSFFVPGSLGVQEGGIAWLFGLAGLGAGAGVSYALFRRARELVWIGLGFGALWWHTRAGGAGQPARGLNPDPARQS